MKIRETLLLIPFFVISISGDGYSQNKLFEEEQIIKTLKVFYREYFLEETKIDTDGRAGRGTDDAKIELLKKKYCTEIFLTKLRKAFKNGLDYDPLANVQDYEMEWYKTLTIKKDKRKRNLYLVNYYPNGENLTVKLIIVKDNGIYKIDSILEPYWKL